MSISSQAVDPEADLAVPGYKNLLIFTDESGIHSNSSHYAFDSFWMPWERRGDLHKLFDEIRRRHGYGYEFKWTKVSSERAKDAVLDLVREFFRRRWMMFHCIVVRKQLVDLSLHGGDDDLARRKHFAKLISCKIGHFLKIGGPDRVFHVRTDVLPSRYAKADEAAEKIINSTLKRQSGRHPVASFKTVDSKESPGVQLADLLVGAVMADRHGTLTSKHKIAVKEEVARHLGWPDLRTDTYVHEWKFNIWEFCDPTVGREAATRHVKLLIPHPSLAQLRKSKRHGAA